MAGSVVDVISSSSTKRSKLWDIFTFYTERASMNGIVFVVDSLHINKRIFWLILLLSATGAMTFHLYSLVSKYLDYAKHSDINIGFSSLEFPAVTICNVNIMRVSKVENASVAVQDFMNRLSQNNLETKVGQNSPENDVIVTGDESDT
uniref:Uncharacterized protein n=1 Tax=Biomphalaria glabrata TaxID=6526 RepID=A0A2C9KN36_BIOGL